MARKTLKKIEEFNKKNPIHSGSMIAFALKMAEQYEEAILDAMEDERKRIAHMIVGMTFRKTGELLTEDKLKERLVDEILALKNEEV